MTTTATYVNEDMLMQLADRLAGAARADGTGLAAGTQGAADRLDEAKREFRAAVLAVRPAIIANALLELKSLRARQHRVEVPHAS